MKKYPFLLALSCSLTNCSQDPSPHKAQSTSGSQDLSTPAAKAVRIVTISPETAYLRSLGSSSHTWNLSEIASFAFITKKQIDTIKTLEGEDIFKSPLYRNNFLAQLYGLNTLLTYMRICLSKINRGDTAVIRFAALDTIKMSNFARKTKHAGEAMVFCERTKAAYVKVNDLASRELLKQTPPAYYITEELRICIFQSLENVRRLIESFEMADMTNQKKGLADIHQAIEDTYKAVTSVQEQTDGLGYLLIERPTDKSSTGSHKPGMDGSSLSTPQPSPVAQAYGFPSAQQLLQSGTTSQVVQAPAPRSPTSVAPQNTPLGSSSNLWAVQAPPTPTSRVGASLSTEAINGPYGANPPPAEPSLFASLMGSNGTPSPAGAPVSGGLAGSLGGLPSLGSLLAGNYSGAPQGQPIMPSIPTAPPPAPPPPLPTASAAVPTTTTSTL